MPPWIDLRTPAVNPLGNNLNGYQSANWINLNAPTVLVDYTSLGVGTPLAAGALPGGGTYTQAVGAGQTEETWVTSWSAGTLARMAFVANTPKIGQAPNGLVGLRLRKSWKNYVRNSNAFDAWTPTGTSVATANTTVSPDGSQNADTLTDNDGAAYEAMSATSDAIPADGETYRLCLYALDTSSETHAAGINWSVTGGTPVARSPRLNTNDGTCVPASGYPNATPFGSWWRWDDQVVNNSTNTVLAFQLFPSSTTIPLPGSDTVAGQGSKTFYEASISRGKLWREPQPTPAGSGATCADCAQTYPASRIVRGGRLRLRFRWTPTGAVTDYNEDCKLVDHGSETTYVVLSASDQKLRVVVAGGATEVCAVPIWWPSASLFSTSHPVVEFDLEIGGGVATRIRYRYSTDGGVTWTLPFDPLGGAAGVAQGNVSASGSVGILTGAAAGNVADGWLHEHEAILTAPAWALQALPTDVASVKAFFRADSSYTLSAGTVSAWAGQTATAVTAFTQATGANQPTFAAAGLGAARPSFTYDGANDYLEAGPLSEWLTRGAVYILFKATAVSANNSPNYNNHPLWENIGAYAGVALRTGPTAGAFNYDGTYDDASIGFALSTAQVLRWRHDVSNVYVRVGANESAPTVSGATALLTGNSRIGGNPGAVGIYYQGEIAAVVAMNTDPTTQEDAAIVSFLNAYGGL